MYTHTHVFRQCVALSSAEASHPSLQGRGRTHTYTHSHTRAYTRTHARTHTQSHTHTHTHTHTRCVYRCGGDAHTGGPAGAGLEGWCE